MTYEEWQAEVRKDTQMGYACSVAEDVMLADWTADREALMLRAPDADHASWATEQIQALAEVATAKIAALRGLVRELFKALQIDGKHREFCGYTFDQQTQTGELGPGCTCGLDALLARADAALAGEPGDTPTVPLEMALCEIDHLFLHPDIPYIFRKMKGCAACEAYNNCRKEPGERSSGAEVARRYTVEEVRELVEAVIAADDLGKGTEMDFRFAKAFQRAARMAAALRRYPDVPPAPKTGEDGRRGE